MNDSYTQDVAYSFLMSLIDALDFRLFPYSPYTEGGALLAEAGFTSLYPNLQSLLNGVCMRSGRCWG